MAWAEWDKVTSVEADKQCSSSLLDLPAATLRHAVLECTKHTCLGLSWETKGKASSAVYSGLHHFRLCKSTATGTASGWRAYWKKPASIATASGTVATISFQHAAQEHRGALRYRVTLPTGVHLGC